jgi:hypothetical protein
MHRCHSCHAGFARKDNLKRHVDTVHDVDRPEKRPKVSPQCAACKREFATHQALQVHTASPTACRALARNFECRYCHRTWPTERQLTEHMEKRKRFPCQLQFDCPLCGHGVSFPCTETPSVCVTCDTEQSREWAAAATLRALWTAPFGRVPMSGDHDLKASTARNVVPKVLDAAQPLRFDRERTYSSPKRTFLYFPTDKPHVIRDTHGHAWFINATAFRCDREKANEPPHRAFRVATDNLQEPMRLPDSAVLALSHSRTLALIVSYLPQEERSATEAVLVDLSLDSDRRIVHNYAKSAQAFCVHSHLWAAIQRHTARCGNRAFLSKLHARIRHVPMLSTLEDCYYWLIQSPHAQLLGRRVHSQLTLDARGRNNLCNALCSTLYCDPQRPWPRQLTEPQRREVCMALGKLTTFDAWHNTRAWASPVVQHMLAVCKPDDPYMSLGRLAILKPLVLPVPKASQIMPGLNACVVHPVLAMTGRVRVISLHDERLGRTATVQRDAEATAYVVYHLLAVDANDSSLLQWRDRYCELVLPPPERT